MHPGCSTNMTDRTFGGLTLSELKELRRNSADGAKFYMALLDAALRHGLGVMVGLAWPQHIPFLDDRKLTRNIIRDAVTTVREIAAHPAALLFALGKKTLRRSRASVYFDTNFLLQHHDSMWHIHARSIRMR